MLIQEFHKYMCVVNDFYNMDVICGESSELEQDRIREDNQP